MRTCNLCPLKNAQSGEFKSKAIKIPLPLKLSTPSAPLAGRLHLSGLRLLAAVALFDFAPEQSIEHSTTLLTSVNLRRCHRRRIYVVGLLPDRSLHLVAIPVFLF